MNQFSPSHENEKLEFQIVVVPNVRNLRTVHRGTKRTIGHDPNQD